MGLILGARGLHYIFSFFVFLPLLSLHFLARSREALTTETSKTSREVSNIVGDKPDLA